VAKNRECHLGTDTSAELPFDAIETPVDGVHYSDLPAA
jgi:hypothetical protein